MICFFSEKEKMIVADFSHVFCDPERFADDSQEVMAQYGMGVLYEKSDAGQTIRNVSPELLDKILRDFYWKHHDKLNTAVNLQLNSFGKALIIDCHSFPSVPFIRDIDQNPNRSDFNIGTDSFHTPEPLTKKAVAFFEKLGYSVGINWPYSGSIVPLEHYNKNKNVQTIMLEINRKLYLNEPSNKKSENYEKIKSVIYAFIREMRNGL